MAQIKFKIGADSSEAQAAFKKTATTAQQAGKESKAAVDSIKTAARSLSVSEQVAQWEQMAKAVRELRKEESALARERQKSGRVGTAASGSSGGMGLLAAGGAAVSRLAAPLLAMFGAQQVLSGVMGSARAADGVFKRRAELDAAFGRGEGERVWQQVGEFGLQTGADPQKQAELVARLGRAGVDSGRAVQLVQQSTVAMRGDLDKAATLLESVTAAASGEGLSSRVLKQLEREGLDIRSALAEVTGKSSEEIDKAVSSRALSMRDFYEALAKLTGEGSTALAAFNEQQKSFSAEAGKLAVAFGNLQEAFGARLAPKMAAVAEKLRAFLGAVNAEIFGESDEEQMKRLGAPVDLPEPTIMPAFQKMMDESAERDRVREMETAAAAQWSAGEEARVKEAAGIIAERDKKAGITGSTASERMQSLKALTGGLSTTEEINAALNSGALGAALRAGGLQKRFKDAVSALAEFGLTGDATDADFERVAGSLVGDKSRFAAFSALRSELQNIGELSGAQGSDLGSIREAVAGNAAENRLTPDLAARARDLLTARDALGDINKELEKEAKKEAEIARKQDDLRASARERLELEEMRARGDEQGLRNLQQQAEAAKLVKEYTAAGIGLAEAQQMAADEVAARGRADDAASAREKSKQTSLGSSSVIGNSVAQMGGGGLLRVYDISARSAQESAKNTATISRTASSILDYLKSNPPASAAVAVLG